MTTNPYPIVERYKEEESYYDQNLKENVKFPHISEDCSVNLSVVVPAYNEEERCKFLLLFIYHTILKYTIEVPKERIFRF